MEKNLTDVIAELIEKNQQILLLIQNIDLTNKLILRRLDGLGKDGIGAVNSMPAPSIPSSVINVSVPNQPSVAAAESPKMKPAKPYQSPTNKALDESARKQDAADKQAEKVINNRSIGKKKIPVQQKLVFEDGKIVFLARVTVYDQDNNEVANVSSNASGEIKLALQPGTYKSKVFKNKSEKRPEIDFTYEMTIPENVTVAKLPVQKIG